MIREVGDHSSVYIYIYIEFTNDLDRILFHFLKVSFLVLKHQFCWSFNLQHHLSEVLMIGKDQIKHGSKEFLIIFCEYFENAYKHGLCLVIAKHDLPRVFIICLD